MCFRRIAFNPPHCIHVSNSKFTLVMNVANAYIALHVSEFYILLCIWLCVRESVFLISFPVVVRLRSCGVFICVSVLYLIEGWSQSENLFRTPCIWCSFRFWFSSVWFGSVLFCRLVEELEASIIIQTDIIYI